MDENNKNTTVKRLIEDILHRLDLLERPYAFYYNPNDKDWLAEVLPLIEERAVVNCSTAVEEGKAIYIDRKDLELKFVGEAPGEWHTVDYVDILSYKIWEGDQKFGYFTIH